MTPRLFTNKGAYIQQFDAQPQRPGVRANFAPP
jgi:hypothetical protein